MNMEAIDYFTSSFQALLRVSLERKDNTRFAVGVIELKRAASSGLAQERGLSFCLDLMPSTSAQHIPYGWFTALSMMRLLFSCSWNFLLRTRVCPRFMSVCEDGTTLKAPLSAVQYG